MPLIKQICCLIALWLCSCPLYAQLQGYVVDEQTSRPVHGAHVIAGNETTITDTAGRFSLKKPVANIIVSHIAYWPDTLIIGRDTQQVVIRLKPLTREIEAITIRGNLNEFPLIRMPAAIGYINDLERQNMNAVSWVENLNIIPGLFVHTGTLNTNRITIRGIGSRTPYGTNRIKAYFNEIPLTTGDGSTEIEDISASLIGSVEVLKGSKSALYGSGLGGAIVLNKPRYRNGLHGSARIGMASFRTFEYEAGIQYRHKGYDVGAHYSRATSDGWRENSEYQSENFALNMGLTSARNQFELTMLAIKTRAGISSSLSEEIFNDSPEKAAQNWLQVKGYEAYSKLITGLKFKHVFNKHLYNSTHVFFHLYKGYESRPFNILDDESFNWGFRNITTIQYANIKIQAGIEALFEDYSWKIYETLSGEQGEAESRFSEDRTPLSIFINAQYQFKNKTVIEAGISLNTLSYELFDEFEDSVDLSGSYRYDWIYSPFIGVNVPVGSGLHLYSSISQGFSAPSVEETLLPEGNINPDLKPETGLNAEAGLRYNSKNERLFIDAGLFGIWVNNLLLTKRETEDIFYGANAGKTRHTGLEISSVLRLNTNHKMPVTLKLNYSYIRAVFTEFIDDGTDHSGNYLPGIPRQNIWFSALFETSFGLYLLPQYQFTGQQYLNDANDKSYGAYHIVNFKAGYTIDLGKLKTALEFGVGNVLDEHYASMILVNAPSFGGSSPRYYYPGTPRNYSLSLKFRF